MTVARLMETTEIDLDEPLGATVFASARKAGKQA
jgi:hypothetical protein